MDANEAINYFPITLRIDGSRIVVVGGGNIAARKIRLLINKNAKIEVFAKTVCPELKQLHQNNCVELMGEMPLQAEFKNHIKTCRLVFIATNDHVYNKKISQWVMETNIPVCVVDNPKLSSFITPAIIDRDPVLIAISTGGAAPVLNRKIRQVIEPLLNQSVGKIAQFMGKYRTWVKKHLPNTCERRKLWEAFLDGQGSSLIESNNEKKCFDYLKALTKNYKTSFGEIALVGAGPGDPDLLTLKALHCLQNADVVLHDHLLSSEILNRVRRDAHLIYVGKQKKKHTVSQKEINELLQFYAYQGKKVVRLKGGDPFIFGRGGEEAEYLMNAHIPFRLIPGISAANGCASASGIPLTHRDCAQTCLILTGHTQEKKPLDVPWESMMNPHQTLVIYMGLGSLDFLCQELVKKGFPSSWPAAAIEKGTLPEQKIVTGTLENLAKLVTQHHFESPVLIIIGQVVSHRVISP
ncbi:Siroheme synthase [Commensalibacter sp. Nvir]|uniref:siroheme synthase CysG n=1 Tax=Commensalibacter sp. Nvir TaxID=3069817 RepID=UPI002D470BA7|nr:Siroheme synthase [Commensalibacter sp. Nvir]